MKQVAQGDLLARKIETIPETATHVAPKDNRHVIAHSETGHHHWVDAEACEYFADPGNPLIAYLAAEGPITLHHDRSFDQHAPVTLPPGQYEIRRQREYTPEGWRRVED